MIYRNKQAFTLAEVLITIGIIGVVAALVVPELVSRVGFQYYRNEYKKGISIIAQAVEQSAELYDFDFSLTKQTCTQGGLPSGEQDPYKVATFCSMFNKTIRNVRGYNPGETRIYSGKGTAYQPKNFNGTDIDLRYYTTYVLPDGMFLFFANDAKECKLRSGLPLDNNALNVTKSDWYGGGYGVANCKGYIDVNGANRPNKEVKCSTGTTSISDLDAECVVNNSDISDIYPIVLYNKTVRPASNAAKYVLAN